MWRKYGMPPILYPLPKIVKNFNTIVFTGGTGHSIITCVLVSLKNSKNLDESPGDRD
jgi:hypothetical protein